MAYNAAPSDHLARQDATMGDKLKGAAASAAPGHHSAGTHHDPLAQGGNTFGGSGQRPLDPAAPHGVHDPSLGTTGHHHANTPSTGAGLAGVPTTAGTTHHAGQHHGHGTHDASHQHGTGIVGGGPTGGVVGAETAAHSSHAGHHSGGHHHEHGHAAAGQPQAKPTAMDKIIGGTEKMIGKIDKNPAKVEAGAERATYGKAAVEQSRAAGGAPPPPI